jgi:regulator of RNase E activity RraA
VVLDGVGIFPGDYVHADSSGAVVVPSREIREVLEEAIRVNEEDVAHTRDQSRGSR